MKSKLLFLFVMFLSSIFFVFAHGHPEEEAFNYADPVFYLYVVVVILILATIAIIIGKDSFVKKYKKPLFLVFVIPTALITVYMIGATIHENIVSDTKGPVHWHLIYKISACGEDLNLIDPSGLKNKIGTPLLHEHDDNQIHIEGTVLELESITLGEYFETIGGELDTGVLRFNTQDKGMLEFHDGDLCPDGNPGTLKVFVNGKRIENFNDYIGYPDVYVPPGDCAIIRFDGGDDMTTDELCDGWEIAGWDYENYVSKRPAIRAYGRYWEGYE